MINLRDILNGLVIGSRDWPNSLTSAKVYKSSLIDDLIALPNLLYSLPNILWLTEWIHHSRWIYNLTASLHSPSQLSLPCWCIFTSNMPSYLYSTYFIFSLSSPCKTILLPQLCNQQLYWSLPFLNSKSLYWVGSAHSFSLSVTHSPLFSQKSQTTTTFSPKTASPIYSLHLHHSALPLVWDLVTSCLNDIWS